MKKTYSLILSTLFGLLALTGCDSTEKTIVPTSSPSATPQTNVEYKVLPTPVHPGVRLAYGDIEVEMRQVELTGVYTTKFGSKREPPSGVKFFWVRTLFKNTGQVEYELPTSEHFSVLFDEMEFKPTYGYREGYEDYMGLPSVLYPGQEVDAWLRFDIPIGVASEDLQFAFLPESFQVSLAFSPSDYPWGDHPIFLWTCAP